MRSFRNRERRGGQEEEQARQEARVMVMEEQKGGTGSIRVECGAGTLPVPGEGGGQQHGQGRGSQKPCTGKCRNIS